MYSLKRIFPLLILVLLVLIINSNFILLINAQKEENYIEYFIKVDNEGSAIIEISYKNNERNKIIWIAVPSEKSLSKWIIENDTLIYTNLSPLIDISTNSTYYFYDNLTIFMPHPGSFKIKYNFSMSSLIYEPNAYFMSPHIMFSLNENALIKILLQNVENIEYYYPKPYKEEKIDERTLLLYFIFGSFSQRTNRIEIYYKVTGKLFLEKVKINKFTGLTPLRYKKIMENILFLYNKMYENLSKIFHTNLENISVRFFTPKLGEVSIQGYTPFNASSLGDIYLNIFYIRFIKGYFEQAAIHELLHHFLWSIGISPEVLWFHEGAANFFSIYLIKKIGFEGAEMIEKDFLNKGKQMKYLGFIESWTPYRQPVNMQDYYIASYMVFYYLNETYGFEIFEKLFCAINERKEIIKKTSEIVYILNNITGEDTSKRFLEWGFSLSNENYYEKIFSYKNQLIELMLKFILMSSIIIFIAILLRIAIRKEIPIRYAAVV
ncbi:MAG: hypothetical protein QW755_02130 [Nitrososphaerota archaeon]